MRMHRLVLAAIAVTLATSTVASAAPRPVKYCVEDAKGDGRSKSLPGVSSPMLDILSANITTNRNELRAELRLDSVTWDGDMWVRLGYNWVFGAVGGGTTYAFRAKLTGSGDLTGSVTVGDLTPKYTFKVDPKAKSFVWTFPRKGLKPMARPKLVWQTFNVNSNVFSGTADDASDYTTKYNDQAKSCVK